MPSRIRTVARGKYVNFLRKSDEFYRSAENALERGDWNAAVSHAVHASISMADALATFYLAQRSASQDHAGTVELLGSIDVDPRELDRNKRHLSALLEVKGIAEYEERLLEESDARRTLEHCRRFRQWAKGKLPG